MATTASNPPEQQPGNVGVNLIVDPLINLVVDPVSDLLNLMADADHKSNIGFTGPSGNDTADASNPYSDVSPTLGDVNGLIEILGFEGTPL